MRHPPIEDRELLGRWLADRYLVLSRVEIGEDRFYRAVAAHDRFVTLAIPPDREQAEQLARRCGALLRVDDTVLVRLLDSGRLRDGRPFFVLEPFDGVPLSEALVRGPLSLASVHAILARMTRAMEALRRQRIALTRLPPSRVHLLDGDACLLALDVTGGNNEEDADVQMLRGLALAMLGGAGRGLGQEGGSASQLLDEVRAMVERG